MYKIKRGLNEGKAEKDNRGKISYPKELTATSVGL